MVRVFGPNPGWVGGAPPVSGLIRVAGVVVVTRVEGRDGRRRVVVQDERGAGRDLREVHDHVGPLGGAEQQGVVGHVEHHDVAPVVLVVDGLVRQDHRRGQHPALVADLDHLRAGCRRVRHPPVAAVSRPGRRETSCLARLDHRDLAGVSAGQRPARIPHRRTGLGVIQLQVEHAVVARVQDPEAVGLALHLEVRVGGPVDQRRVHERFRDDARGRCAGCQRRLPRRVAGS